MAKEFADNEKVIFDTSKSLHDACSVSTATDLESLDNEYHDMDQTLVLDLNQAAINGIRAAGATTQYIFVEGNAYSGAWDWTDNNDNLSGLTDSEDKIIYEMHQYLDSDSSGTSETCVSSTIGAERLKSATAWLKSNNKKGFIGEFAGGVNTVCEEAVEGMLAYMSENSDVWTGAEWWSAGPWWGSYMYSLEPTDGAAYSTYLPILEKYFVSGSSSNSSSAAVTSATSTATASSTSSAAAEATTSATATSTPVASVDPVSASGSTTTVVSVNVPTTHPTTSAVATPASSSASASTPSASGAVAKLYYQCGGINWTGPTTCEKPYTCKVQNPYYYQCVEA